MQHEPGNSKWAILKTQQGEKGCALDTRVVGSTPMLPRTPAAAEEPRLGRRRGSHPFVTSRQGRETGADRYSPAAPCPPRSYTRQGVRNGRGRDAGTPGARVFRPARDAELVRFGSGGSRCSAPHPPLLNFNGRHPFSPRCSRLGQSSPSPPPGTNRSALCLTKPHPRATPPTPS